MKTRTKEFSDVCNVIRDRFLADGRSEPIRVELQYEKCMIRPEANGVCVNIEHSYYH